MSKTISEIIYQIVETQKQLNDNNNLLIDIPRKDLIIHKKLQIELEKKLLHLENNLLEKILDNISIQDGNLETEVRNMIFEEIDKHDLDY